MNWSVVGVGGVGCTYLSAQSGDRWLSVRTSSAQGWEHGPSFPLAYCIVCESGVGVALERMSIVVNQQHTHRSSVAQLLGDSCDRSDESLFVSKIGVPPG